MWNVTRCNDRRHRWKRKIHLIRHYRINQKIRHHDTHERIKHQIIPRDNHDDERRLATPWLDGYICAGTFLCVFVSNAESHAARISVSPFGRFDRDSYFVM
jgi:hypothetical protein